MRKRIDELEKKAAAEKLAAEAAKAKKPLGSAVTKPTASSVTTQSASGPASKALASKKTEFLRRATIVLADNFKIVHEQGTQQLMKNRVELHHKRVKRAAEEKKEYQVSYNTILAIACSGEENERNNFALIAIKELVDGDKGRNIDGEDIKKELGKESSKVTVEKIEFKRAGDKLLPPVVSLHITDSASQKMTHYQIEFSRDTIKADKVTEQLIGSKAPKK